MNILSEEVKKNLLDLNYNKYLQYFNTTIIIIFSYIIAVGIGFLTNTINYNEKGQVLLLVFISIASLGILTLLLFYFKEHMEKIMKEIKKLKI